jgi:GT2 family glycosyltransferase
MHLRCLMNISNPTLCIAILNFNGISFLEQLVPSLRLALKRWGRQCSIVILDNRSTESDCEWAQKNCPDFEFISAPANEMLYSYNWFIPCRTEDVIILLNNDVRLSENFIAPLARHFKCDDVFSVGATSRDWEDRKYTCGPWHLKARRGLYYWGYDENNQLLNHTFLTVGGFMAVDRKKFIELGGFNRLFYPAYCEETELCFRAWRRGWRCIFEPASLVNHYHGGTFEKFRETQMRLQLRSYFLFQWACLPDIKPVWLTSALIAARCLRYTVALKHYWPQTYTRTRKEWEMLKESYRGMKTDGLELESILRRISLPVENCL